MAGCPIYWGACFFVCENRGCQSENDGRSNKVTEQLVGLDQGKNCS